MIRGKCPICRKAFEIAGLDDLPTFPFCTERCKMVDLGRWIDGAYAIPAKAPADNPTDPEGQAEDEDED